MDKIKQMLGKSPLEQRCDDAELIKTLKNKVEVLMNDSDKYWKLRKDLLDIKNNNNLSDLSEENRRYASEMFSKEDRELIFEDAINKFRELQKTKEDLRVQIETLMNKYKQDPSVMGPSFSDSKAELDFLEKKLDKINTHIQELNKTARGEFFSKGAILEDGNKNPDYYHTRNEIDQFKVEKDSTEMDAAFQDQQLEWKSSDLEYKQKNYEEVAKLADIIEKQAENLTETLERQQAFLAYAKENNLPIDLKKITDILDKVEISFAQNIGALEDIGGDLYKQGIRVKSEDLQPYIKNKPLVSESV